MLERRVAVVRAVEEVEGAGACASAATWLFAVVAQWNGPRAIDCDRPSSDSVLCSARRAQAIAQRRVDRVAAGAGIDEQRHARAP